MKQSQVLVNRDIATIQIKKQTRERLGKMGSLNETYDDFINRLLDFWEESHINKK